MVNPYKLPEGAARLFSNQSNAKVPAKELGCEMGF